LLKKRSAILPDSAGADATNLDDRRSPRSTRKGVFRALAKDGVVLAAMGLASAQLADEGVDLRPLAASRPDARTRP
jgi:hypothetical protein